MVPCDLLTGSEPQHFTSLAEGRKAFIASVTEHPETMAGLFIGLMTYCWHDPGRLPEQEPTPEFQCRCIVCKEKR